MNQQNPEVLAEYAGSSALKADCTYGNGRLSTSNAAAEGVVGQTVPASYISNGQNSVQTLLSNAGTALASYSYGPFGETETANVGAGGDSGVQASFYGYNGENFDSLTNLQYLRARYYDPASGRFTAADTNPGMLLNPLTQTLYSYEGNNPINYSDPSGHAWYNDLWNGIVYGANVVVTAAKNIYNNVIKPAVYNYIIKPATNIINSIFSPPSAPSANSGGGNSVPGRPGTTWTPTSPPGLPAILTLPVAALIASTTNMALYLQAGGTVSRDTAQQYTSRLVSMANPYVCTTASHIEKTDNPTIPINSDLLNTSGVLSIGGGITISYIVHYERKTDLYTAGNTKDKVTGVNFHSIDFTINGLNKTVWPSNRVEVRFGANGPAYSLNGDKAYVLTVVKNETYTDVGSGTQVSLTGLMGSNTNRYFADITSTTLAFILVDVYLNAGGGHPETKHYTNGTVVMANGAFNPQPSAPELSLEDMIALSRNWEGM